MVPRPPNLPLAATPGPIVRHRSSEHPGHRPHDLREAAASFVSGREPSSRDRALWAPSSTQCFRPWLPRLRQLPLPQRPLQRRLQLHLAELADSGGRAEGAESLALALTGSARAIAGSSVFGSGLWKRLPCTPSSLSRPSRFKGMSWRELVQGRRSRPERRPGKAPRAFYCSRHKPAASVEPRRAVSREGGRSISVRRATWAGRSENCLPGSRQ